MTDQASDLVVHHGVTMVLRKAHRDRVTGFSIVCTVHGVAQVLAPSRSAAIIEAGRHLEIEHKPAVLAGTTHIDIADG